jgi:signal transduction histidine kinase/DNA-binding NarL/FixJ family response regulator
VTGPVTGPVPVGTRATRVLLADDSDGLRLLVRSWLLTVEDLEVVAEASNGAEAVALTEAHRPDVVVLDVAMPVMDGLVALTELHRRFPTLPVVMLSGFAERDVAEQAARRGAYAFVEKSGDLDPLVEVVRRAASGPATVPQPREGADAAPERAPRSTAPPAGDALPALDEAAERDDAADPARGPRTGRLVTAAAVLSFPALLLLRLQVEDPRSPVLLLMTAPVLVLAIRHGLRGGLLGALAASAVFTAWAATVPDVAFGHLDHVARYVVFLLSGVVAGISRDRLARASQRERLAREAVVASNRRLAEANARLLRVNAELEASNDDLRQFGYVVSHDLAEPLRAMGSFADLLQRRYGPALDDTGRQYTRFIAEGAVRMQALIADLRDYTRAGQAELVGRPVDLADVLRDVRGALRASLEEHAAVIRQQSLPVVQGDRSMLAIVLQNLLANALTFNDSPVPVVEVRAEPADAAGTAWRIEVRDNGIGIDPAATERVFGLFTRLHPREDYPGTGLGLAIAKRIVERHRGTIEIGPREDGGGTVARFTLPSAGRGGP